MKPLLKWFKGLFCRDCQETVELLREKIESLEKENWIMHKCSYSGALPRASW